MRYFNIGDRVLHGEYGYGTVVEVCDGNSIGIEFDLRKMIFHSMCGKTPDNKGYYVSPEELKLVVRDVKMDTPPVEAIQKLIKEYEQELNETGNYIWRIVINDLKKAIPEPEDKTVEATFIVKLKFENDAETMDEIADTLEDAIYELLDVTDVEILDHSIE